MFRGQGYTERADIIGNKKFLEFVDNVEKREDLRLDTFEIGKDKLKILLVMPMPEKAAYDRALPGLTPSLPVRRRSPKKSKRWM
jgi:type III restriction enzyme